MERREMKGNGYYLSEVALKAYYEEYFNATEDKPEKLWNIFVLINRKGYWDYKIFFPDGIKSQNGSRMVISDRYLDKCPLKELRKFFGDKNVIIYDDSLSNGSNLFYYFLLCRSMGARNVIPVVYALNIDFPSEKSYELMRRESNRSEIKGFFSMDSVNKLIDEFVGRLQYRLLLNTCEIDILSIWQTQLFQKAVSPLVMDLPILNHTHSSSGTHIAMSIRQFEKLCHAESASWQFVENEMNGWGNPIKASYFHYKDGLLEGTFPSLVHDFVVKCKYEKDGDYVKVVFTPFAIVKSGSFQTIRQCFELFYNGTAYAQKLLKNNPNMDMEKDCNFAKALFRSVIFVLSSYIGRKFQEHLNKILNLELEYDWDIMKDNFDAAFIETLQEWHRTFDDKSFKKKLLRFQDNKCACSINSKSNISTEKTKATQELVRNYVLSRVIEKKQDSKISLAERIYTLETMQFELESRFYFETSEEEKKMITDICLLFLETNIFGNHIFIDQNESILYRGFRYGENSEIMLHENLWFFYAYLYAYYNNTIENLKEGYASFMFWLENHLRKRRYMGVWISEDGFYFLRNYFGKMDSEELEQEIKRRRYLLESYGYGEEGSVRAEIIREAAYSTKQWGKV